MPVPAGASSAARRAASERTSRASLLMYLVMSIRCADRRGSAAPKKRANRSSHWPGPTRSDRSDAHGLLSPGELAVGAGPHARAGDAYQRP